MKILYIHQYFATPRGHTGTRSWQQARAMRRAGHRVLMLTSIAQLRPEEVPPGGLVRRGRIGGLEAIVVPIAYSQRMRYLRRMWSFFWFMLVASWVAVTEPGVDLVFATSTPLTVGVPCLAARILRGRPYVFEVRDLMPAMGVTMGIIRRWWQVAALEFLEWFIYAQARLIVAVNDDVAAFIRRRTDGRKRALVVPNACDVAFFRPDRDGSAFRRDHALEGKVLCVYAGAIGLISGIDTILDAAGALRDEPDVRFVLIGDGNQKDRLRRRAADDGLTNVLFLDPMPKEDLADVLAGGDVGLMTVSPYPILELNCANKFFDYLASGLPVALNYGGWQARVLAEHGCGVSAPQGDTAGFIKNLRRLVASADLRREMGGRARRLAETGYERGRVVRPLLEALAGLERPMQRR